MLRLFSIQFLFAVVVFPTMAATAAQAAGPRFSFRDLENLISRDSIKTIDDLIPRLPLSLRQNPLLVYDSHALNTYLVTPSTPRVILFNKDASLILAFTRDPGAHAIATGKDALEVIHFDRNAGTFKIGELAFDGQHPPAGLKNSGKCLQCHGENPRPIFQDYNAWPGFYGSFGTRGVAVKGGLEYDHFKNFLSTRLSLPRYKDLDLSAVNEESAGIATPVRGYGNLHEKNKFSINLTFGALVESRMHDRLGKKLVSLPQFRQIEALFYHLGERTDRCGAIRDRIKDTYADLVDRPHGELQAADLLSGIVKQVFIDYLNKEQNFLKHNIPSREVDGRGLINIPFENLARGYSPDAVVDRVAFEKQLILMETAFRHLNLDESDISTTPGFPTTGLFHLSRLGRLLVDEQFFQNLIAGIEAADPSYAPRFNSLDCAAIRSAVRSTLQALSIPSALQSGVLYQRGF